MVQRAGEASLWPHGQHVGCGLDIILIVYWVDDCFARLTRSWMDAMR